MKKPLVFSNFQEKILQSYLIIVVGGLILFYTLVAVITRKSSLKAAERSQISTCMEVSQQLESSMVEIRSVGFQMMMNSRLAQDFGTFSDDKANDNYYGNHTIDHINVVSTLADIDGIWRVITRISVLNRYRDYVSSGVIPQSKAHAGNILHSHMDLDEIASRLVLNGGHIYVEGPHSDYWNSKVDYEMIPLYCLLGNKIQDDMHDIIEIQQNFQELVKTLLPGFDQSMAVLLFDSSGRCIFNSMEGICLPEYCDFYYSQASRSPDSRYGFYRIKIGNKAQKQYLSAGVSETSGQMAVMVRNKSSTVNMIQDIQKVIIMAIPVLMVLSAYMAYRISPKAARPINNMIISARSISWSNLDMKMLEENDENEIMAFNSTFKGTPKHLSKSMQLELGVRPNALQSQMNPRFLYSTLSVISASADQQEKVERACSRPFGMLRCSTVHEEENNNTLEGEVRHVENYLELVKDRYEGNLIYSTEETGELERAKVPRVILQPIAENCFKHGFGEDSSSWIIHVTVTISHGHWRIHVGSNGRSFQDRDLTELNEKVEEFLKGEQRKISGIGLTSTTIRLRPLYEEQIECEIYTGNDGYIHMVLKGNCKWLMSLLLRTSLPSSV